MALRHLQCPALGAVREHVTMKGGCASTWPSIAPSLGRRRGGWQRRGNSPPTFLRLSTHTSTFHQLQVPSTNCYLSFNHRPLSQCCDLTCKGKRKELKEMVSKGVSSVVRSLDASTVAGGTVPSRLPRHHHFCRRGQTCSNASTVAGGTVPSRLPQLAAPLPRQGRPVDSGGRICTQRTSVTTRHPVRAGRPGSAG